MKRLLPAPKRPYIETYPPIISYYIYICSLIENILLLILYIQDYKAIANNDQSAVDSRISLF